MFDESYGLAHTQQFKNKDIPEGGSKGVILLDAQHQDKGRLAFEKYIDSIMDLLIPPTSPGIKDPIVDLYGKPEMLFMGPDENTADLVDWATEHAYQRGAAWWKSFFTGKSPKLGGIPHDTYGMTTLSIREYVTGIYRKLHLDPSKVRKMQTGGPDGDLGSNEILLSKEKYISIIDGSGVLVDPNGINYEELIRLAKKRVTISEFDTSKLSTGGYRVLIDEINVKLPNGELVHNGMTFRNTFHLRNTNLVDSFVPCGGRPESVDLISVNQLIKDGKSTIPYIVEGANLFITQDAKLCLEKSGCILFKDASTNKGGVTSSSLEVLASLSFDDQGFIENMCVGHDGNVPEFYKEYVKYVQDVIKQNATLEFEAIWREHEHTGIPRSTISDMLSVAITKLNEELQKSQLWHNQQFRRTVLSDALPKLLLKKIGLDLISERVCHLFRGQDQSLNTLYRFRKIISELSSAATLPPDLCTSSGVVQVNTHSSTCKSLIRFARFFNLLSANKPQHVEENGIDCYQTKVAWYMNCERTFLFLRWFTYISLQHLGGTYELQNSGGFARSCRAILCNTTLCYSPISITS
jgi:glutamate dehydrogenase